MRPLLDYFLLVANKLIEILDSLSFNGSYSLLYYLLGAIIIGFIIKIIKGGASEFDSSTNFLNGRIVSTKFSKYSKNNNARKEQIIKEKAFVNGMVAGNSFDSDVTIEMMKKTGIY